MDKEEFVKLYKVGPSAIDMQTLVSFFLSEMEKGLKKEQSSLEMIPSYFNAGLSLPEGGTAIVIDAGGTNLRTCLVSFAQDGPQISGFSKGPMPGSLGEVSKKQFFGQIAERIEPFLSKSRRIAFCFSYPATILPSLDGIPTSFSKEIRAPEVVGEKLGECLINELKERGNDVTGLKACVLNDTVATLFAAKTLKRAIPGACVGFILGTGTNTCYAESDGMLINEESGGLDFYTSPLDMDFFKTTKNDGEHRFEKLIGGAYLGQSVLTVLKKAASEGVFPPETAAQINAALSLSTAELAGLIREDDCPVSYIVKNMISRSAKLTACNLAATILKSGGGKTADSPVIINADGTTFYKTPGLKEQTESYLCGFLSEENLRYFEIVKIDDSPVIGSAVAALSLGE